jgi:hypothetical protein
MVLNLALILVDTRIRSQEVISRTRHTDRLALDQILVLQVALYFSGYVDTQSRSYFEIKATVS